VVDGWHYDVDANPTKVLMCPQTCQKIQATVNASVSVIFGCPGEPPKLQ
jgi:hypothetical protein